MNVPRSQRGGEIIEPMISTQWFVKIKPLAEAGIAAVKDGRIQIVPERFEKVYFNWMDANIPRLVHLAPVVVGASHSGVVLRRLQKRNVR